VTDGQTSKPIAKYHTLHSVAVLTRKLSYRKDDRAMRPIYGCIPWKFSRVPEYVHGYFSRNF